MMAVEEAGEMMVREITKILQEAGSVIRAVNGLEKIQTVEEKLEVEVPSPTFQLLQMREFPLYP